MYLPKGKYRIKNPPPGTFQTESGIDHRGPVVELSTGEVYAGDSISNLNTRLIDPTQTDTVIEIPQPFNEYIQPTDQEYERGSFTRYLLRNEISKRVVEVSKKQFDQKRNLLNIQPIEVQWILTGPVEDRTVMGNVPVKGVRTRNQDTVNRLKEEFRGIELFLNDPLKFVRV